MAASSLQAKTEAWFTMLDVDGDGVITAEDYDQLADRVVSRFEGADTSKIQEVKREYRNVWEGLARAADADRDGQVTRDEFAAVAMNLSPEGWDNGVRLAAAEFSLADVNGDGYLDRDELSRLIQAYGAAANDADKITRALDKDGDGRVSQQEYEAAVRQYYAGNGSAFTEAVQWV